MPTHSHFGRPDRSSQKGVSLQGSPWRGTSSDVACLRGSSRAARSPNSRPLQSRPAEGRKATCGGVRAEAA
eukprot:1634672-Pyramimonas_sp.AAC.1